MVYDITNFNSEFNKDFGLKEQIRRALVSIMSNIAEGFAKKTDKEFIRFLHIALGSTSEVQSQLYVAFDLCYISEKEFKELYDSAADTAKIINGFIRYLNNN